MVVETHPAGVAPRGLRSGDLLVVGGTVISAAGVVVLAAAIAQGTTSPWLWLVGIGLPAIGAVLLLLAARSGVRGRPWSSPPWPVRFTVEASVLAAAWAVVFLLFLPLWSPVEAWKVAYHVAIVVLLAVALGVGRRRGREGRRRIGDRLRGRSVRAVPDRPGRLRRVASVAAGCLVLLLALLAALGDERAHRSFVIGAMIAQILFWSLGITLVILGMPPRGPRKGEAGHPRTSPG